MRESVSLRISAVFLATFICWFYPYSASAQKPRVKPVGRVSVVDSKGKIVGTILGGLGLTTPVHTIPNRTFAPSVLLDAEGRLIAVEIGQEGFFSDNSLYYESTNCSGTPWLTDIAVQSEPPLHGLLPSVGIGPPGHTVYVPVEHSSPHALTIRSQFHRGRCFSPLLFPPPTGIPTEALIDLDTEFTPPFQLRSGP